MSIQCGCEPSREYFGFQNRHQNEAENISTYDNDVIVPVINDRNGEVEYKKDDNLVVFVDNSENQEEGEEEVDNDILEINADTDSLNDL